MKLTKRILCFALVLALIFALCACGKDEEKKDNSTNPGGFSTPSDNSVPQTTVDPLDGNLEGEDMFNDAELDWG
jgi:hypothetical protein